MAAAVDGCDQQQGAGQGDNGDDQGRAELVVDYLPLHFVIGDVDDAELPQKGWVRPKEGFPCHPPWGTSAGNLLCPWVCLPPLTCPFSPSAPRGPFQGPKGLGGRKRLQ